MDNSRCRIDAAVRGIRPDRTPIFDLLCNDAVIAHFAGRPLDGTADEETAILAARRSLDGTRWIFVPDREGREWTDELGNIRVAARWTSWVQTPARTDVEQWVRWLNDNLDRHESEPPPDADAQRKEAERQSALNAKLGDTLFIHCTPSTAINRILFGYHCGLEHFTYLWTDHRDLTRRWLRATKHRLRNYLALTAHPETCPLAMIYCDIAFRNRLMFGKAMFREIGLLDDVAEICDTCHRKGMKVIFHSDGYLMEILPDLVAAGIDGLNPIEKAAGMDIFAIRRQFPDLILVGGLDVTHLLPNGTPQDVRTETRRIIREVGDEGRLLIGSSTELENNVPLANYLAFHDEVTRGN